MGKGIMTKRTQKITRGRKGQTKVEERASYARLIFALSEKPKSVMYSFGRENDVERVKRWTRS